MAGFSFEELLVKTRQGKKTAESPSTPAPSKTAAVEIDLTGEVPVASATKRNRPRPSGKDVEVDPPFKKSKGGKEKELSKRPSSHLDLERLSDSDFERLKADPLNFAADIARAGARLLAKMKQGEEERAAGTRLYAKNLWLESDNLDKTDKLTRAHEYISELRQQLEAEKEKNREASTALEAARKSLQSVEKERDTAVTNQSKVEEELRAEKAKTGELGDKLSSALQRAEKAEDTWHRLENDFDRLLHSTVDLCQQRFEEAVRQVKYVYPEYEINEDIVKSDHKLVDGRIVVPALKDASGVVVQEEVVVFKRPE